MLTEGKDNKVYFDFYLFITYVITACALVGMAVLFAEGKHLQGFVLYLFSATIIQPCRQIAVRKKLKTKGGRKIRFSEILNEIYAEVRTIQDAGDKDFGENVPWLFKRAMPYFVYLFLVMVYHVGLLIWGVLIAIALHLVT